MQDAGQEVVSSLEIQENFPSKEKAEVHPPKYEGWSLSEVLKLTDESRNKSGQVEIDTALAGVIGSTILLDCGNNYTVSFSTTAENALQSVITSKFTRNEVDYQTDIGPNGVTIDAAGYGKYNISTLQSNEPAVVTITFPDKGDSGSDIVNALQTAGLTDLLKLNNLPSIPEAAIEKKYLSFYDGRTIPVVQAANKEDAISLTLPTGEGAIRLIHGTSFEKAMSVAQNGLFGLDKPNFENPTVTEGFGNAHEAARAKAGLEGWQTYLVIDSNPDEYKNMGGLEEPIGISAKPFNGDRRRLQSFLPREMAESSNLTWIPPERIKQIILVNGENVQR